ncbi:hypothetical protein HBN50_16790 [Halobacteriovorax sp. GB3]|uniref:hypothetical protein n=1 Tax=Halobacteriovorax sp. GB3 TaxID=2719615 RepID=UPI002362394C|nr:hypothetical protein [Halobacteriovorax sp. GB3]MDD0854769.1 hypothetical protein [Halobacteriovorax sp. GB3]
MFKTKSLFAALALTATSAHALPIDWHGVFGVDTTLINNYRRIKATSENVPYTSSAGSQEVTLAGGSQKNASYQSYVFRLNPHLIVNDSASIKAEITSGYGRGGRLGENDDQTKKGDAASALYYYNTSTDNQLNLNKVYMELYSDTATYVIGRHSAHWGMGAIQNSGDNVWDRHTFVRDGITAKIKIGNFFISPYWAKISSDGSLTRSHRVKETGISLFYDNVDNDIAFGVLYAKKKNSNNGKVADEAGSQAFGETNVKITDLYFKKTFDKLKFEVEVPIMSGELGDVYGNSDNVKYKAQAILFSSSYQANDSWSFGFDAGKVSGQSATQSSFEAMYLNPNFQIANLLFRYNMRAVSDESYSLYDSYVTNTMYGKLRGQYKTNKWTWDAALIYAKAEEVAQANAGFYNHEGRAWVGTANVDQKDDLGMEVDLGFTYDWNEAVAIGGQAAYLFAGDYWAFTNDASNVNEANNSYLLQLNASIKF